MPVGGAETLLVNLARRMDPARFAVEILCLKEAGPLGEQIASEFPVSTHFLHSKYDLRVLPRLVSHFRTKQVDAVITVGAGDKMFWGRLAASLARVPVIASALHSTGWPDGVGRLNRLLTRITDAFIAVANPHGKFLVDFEKFPSSKVFVIPNGVDTDRFVSDPSCREDVRRELGIPSDSSLVGIVAALRHEKNHNLFVEMAARLVAKDRRNHFMIVGDGPEKETIQKRIRDFGIADNVHLLGSRADTPRLLAALDVFALTSHNEANPVSILEAMSCGIPVVATDVGSVSESVRSNETGFLVPPGKVEPLVESVEGLLLRPDGGRSLGCNGRAWVSGNGSLQAMVDGYQQLLEKLFAAKVSAPAERSARHSRVFSHPSPTCHLKATPPSL